MINFRALVHGFRDLAIESSKPVLVHSSMSAFGEVQGGVDTLLGALRASFQHLMVPAFTYRTMVTPETGPEHNAITYGAENGSNRAAQFFRPDLPADPLMGVLAETVRQHPQAQRSRHPILSFAAIDEPEALAAQTLHDPLEPVGALAAAGGWVLLLGVDQTVNTSIHYGERLAGRKMFIRWALTPHGVVECQNIPGCSQGFNSITGRLAGVSRTTSVGEAFIQAISLADLLQSVQELIAENPEALLCPRDDCVRCQEVRISLKKG